MPPRAASLLYVTTALEAGTAPARGGIHVSSDGGRTWRAANGGLLAAASGLAQGEVWGDAKGSRPSFGPVAASERNGQVAYVGLRGIRKSAEAPSSTASRRPWTAVAPGASFTKKPTPVPPTSKARGSRSALRTDGYSIWFDAPYDLAVAPTNPNVCFATDLFRTYRTQDGGKSWAQVNSARRGE